MPGLRLFIALDLPDAIRQTLAGLRTEIPGASWSNPANLHLTLRFLGDGIDETLVPDLQAALATIHSPPLSLALHGVGRFPPGDRQPPRVLWAAVEAPPALDHLAKAVEQAVAPLGFPPEGGPFAPHLTLARLKSREGDAATARFLARHAGLTSPPFIADAFHLYASQLSAHGARYQRLAAFPFQT